MKKMNKKGFTKVELIIVIAIVAVLAAILIAAFASIIKNGNSYDQQIADINAKLESQQTLTPAEIEAMIAGIKLPEGVTSDDVSKAIADAINGIKIPEAGLTEAQVNALITAAINKITHPESGLSAAEVEKIVNDAIGKITLPDAGLSVADIQKIVNDAIKKVNTGLTSAEVKKIVNDAIEGIKHPESGLSAAEVEKIVNDAIKNIKPCLTAEDVEAAIKEALSKYLTEEEIKDLIDKALADLKPEDTTEPEDTTKPEASKATSIELSTTYLALNVGTSGSISAIVLDQNGNVMPDAEVVWSTTNTMCAYVNNGLVYGIASGSTTVTATVKGTTLSATCLVYVGGGAIVPPPSTVAVTSVSLNKTTATLNVGDMVALVATVLPANATNKNVKWSTSNASVATVENGVVTAVAAGTATITVTTVDGAKTATCVVTVISPLSIEEQLQAGGTVKLTSNYTMTEWFGINTTATLDLNGYTLTLAPEFYGINILGDVTITNGYIVTNRSGQIYVVAGGSLTLTNVTATHMDGRAAGISNRGTITIDGCNLICANPYDSQLLVNGTVQDGNRYPGVMTITNTTIGGTYKTNYAVIDNTCGSITFGNNVVINAIRPVEAEGGTPYYQIVENEDAMFGSVTINGKLVSFN